MTADNLGLLVLVVLYLMLGTFLFSLGIGFQDTHQYLAYFLFGLGIASVFIFLPLTVWYFCEIGWITLPPSSNLTEIRNLTI